MEAVTTLPRTGMTRDDLAALVPEEPDDGHRYELIDGTLIVTPAPGFRHQVASVQLTVLLHQACPSELAVLTAPFAVGLGVDTEVQPDLLVASRDAFTDKDLPGAPLLAVEILSPSTRLIDLNLKKARYEEAGCASYWVVDPLELRLLAWELRDGTYVQVADVGEDEAWSAVLPFPVTITPSTLA
ncbi:Uma2 family endonuclease [Nocardioides sp.]|uniref:Uma2 family endonuclease n=1 Tax=Nocardioides sp. TaxID=35761 RepID=UPI002B26C9C6|nr:Uma2 family endonuclease [Nocardioides sp.]